jgi:hypothetical protein
LSQRPALGDLLLCAKLLLVEANKATARAFDAKALIG